MVAENDEDVMEANFGIIILVVKNLSI